MKRIMLRSIALHRGEKQDSLFAWPSCQVAGHLLDFCGGLLGRVDYIYVATKTFPLPNGKQDITI
jgi:hypothetical protein